MDILEMKNADCLILDCLPLYLSSLQDQKYDEDRSAKSQNRCYFTVDNRFGFC
jgi:hypothetical protein